MKKCLKRYEFLFKLKAPPVLKENWSCRANINSSHSLDLYDNDAELDIVLQWENWIPTNSRDSVPYKPGLNMKML